LQNKYGETPLHIASKNGMVTIVEILINHGADCTIQTTMNYMTLDNEYSYAYWPSSLTPYDFVKLKLAYVKLCGKNGADYGDTFALLSEVMKGTLQYI